MNGSVVAEAASVRPMRTPYRILYALLFLLLVFLIVLLLPGGPRGRAGSSAPDVFSHVVDGKDVYYLYGPVYNTTYPLTLPRRTALGTEYRIAMVADQDEKSRVKDSFTWQSYLKVGTLVVGSGGDVVSVRWDRVIELTSHLSEKGRGAELSELVVFNGKLYTVDDRSGIVFEVVGGKLVPWVILEDGPGTVSKGFKAEWMAVKERQLYVGGLGKEWTSQTGEFVNDHPQYVKIVNPAGVVRHQSWADIYTRMKEAAGIRSKGYIIHESACWSSARRKWYFLPRRASQERYDDMEDEHRATNLLISADEDFRHIERTHIGPLNQFRGFSSFKFIPNTMDTMVVALKSEENRGSIATYMTAFNLHTGRVLMPEKKIAKVKLEGIEFI